MMIFGEKLSDKIKRRTNWKRFYAWMPVKLDYDYFDGRWVWLGFYMARADYNVDQQKFFWQRKQYNRFLD